MLSIRTKKILALTFVAAFTFMAISPMLVTAQTTTFGEKVGPFIDTLVFKVIEGNDQQVLALQADEIDLVGDMVNPVHLQTLEEAANIDVVSVQRNGYGYVTINCDRYPLNITALRRALAFAIDKYKVSTDVWDGLSFPQDSCVPQVNPWSIEGQMPYTYYEENIALGNDLLNASGFAIPEGGEWRNAPNGEPFDITVEAAITSPIALECGEIVAAALRSLHINAVNVPTDFYEYLNRLYFKSSAGYDIVFLGSSFSTFDVDWLAYSYWSEYADVDYYNFPRFRNESYDSWRDQLLYSTEYEDVLEAAHEMQKIWIYQSPMIIMYNNFELSAYRNDRFEGFVNDVSGGVPGGWTNLKVHLKGDTGPFGGTFRWSNPMDIDTFNFMATSSAYAWNVLGELYTGMMTLDPEGLPITWLAESYSIETHADNPAITEGHTRITFDMLQNATWTDGTPLTADDWAYSINFFRDAPGNPYGADLGDVTAAFAPTTYRAVVEFNTESYWHLQNVAYKPVIPKHIFLDIGIDGWATWNPVPPADEMVTSGPFYVTEYVAGEFTELTYNPNFFFAPDRTVDTDTDTDTDTTPPPTEVDWTMALVAGAVGAAVVILVGGYVLTRQK